MNNPAAQVLIVDDDRDFALFYREVLEKQGVQVTVASTTEGAIQVMEKSGLELDVVLLDQKLRGPGGPDVGLDLIAHASALAPFAKTIVVTGYASPEAIERAFGLGVYDYLVKNGAFEALLRAKVRNATEVASERRIAAASAQAVSDQLKAVWESARSQSDRNKKGAQLEELVKRLFHATPGFERVFTRLRTQSEEIDLTIENRSGEFPWRNDGPYLLGECKNWSGKCGPEEVRILRSKMETKFGRVRTGFFIAPGGFTKPARSILDEYRAHPSQLLLVLVGEEDLHRWIDAPDQRARLDVLAELYRRSVFE